MTWKERRNVMLLLTVAGILFFALLIVFGMIYRQNREAALAGTAAATISDTGAPDDPSAYNTLSFFNGSATLSFQLDEKGNWIWADGPAFPLNPDTVTQILETLSSLKFQQVLPAAETQEEYGFDSPSASITASSGEASTQELVFGKTTTDGDSYYMRMNNDETTVYIVADTLVNLTRTPIYDMCALPDLPELNELSLRAVTIQGQASASEDGETSGEDGSAPERPALSLNARRANGGDQSALWFCGDDNVTANALFQDLLHDLDALSITKCVDYFPSAEAAEICGFDSPSATLKVEYASANGDETFTMDVGERMPDDSGRYVRLGESDAVYAMAADHLDAIMSIAANQSLSGGE